MARKLLKNWPASKKKILIDYILETIDLIFNVEK